jgi:small subunit ribosomal protein S6
MFNMETDQEALKEYERVLGLNEDVLRFLNVRIEEVEEGPSIIMQNKNERPSRGSRDGHRDGPRNSDAGDDSDASGSDADADDANDSSED